MDSNQAFGPAVIQEQLAVHFCPACLDLFQCIASPMCTQCGIPFASPHGPDHLCGVCSHQPNDFDLARAAGVYDATLQKAIHQFKYQGRSHLAAPLGRILWHALNFFFRPDDFDLVVPVPLHPSRLRHRGFNQSALLVRQWGQGPSGPAIPTGKQSLKFVPELLVRTKASVPQIGLNKAERRKNLQGAFAVQAKVMVKGKHVLLVDDVLTTGATANACAVKLKQAGAMTVNVLTLARAL